MTGIFILFLFDSNIRNHKLSGSESWNSFYNFFPWSLNILPSDDTINDLGKLNLKGRFSSGSKKYMGQAGGFYNLFFNFKKDSEKLSWQSKSSFILLFPTLLVYGLFIRQPSHCRHIKSNFCSLYWWKIRHSVIYTRKKIRNHKIMNWVELKAGQ